MSVAIGKFFQNEARKQSDSKIVRMFYAGGMFNLLEIYFIGNHMQRFIVCI